MSSERILVVDDEEAIREVVCSMLATASYKCRGACSGAEALSILNSGEEFELMLSDLMMPELDGIGLLERTKEMYPDMPVVMVTAVHDISVALGAIRNGAYDYLLKPFERDQLLATVRRGLENRRLKLENRTYQLNLESLVAARTMQLRQAMADLERTNKDLERAMAELERTNKDLERKKKELERTNKDLVRSYDITLEALGDALDLKDAETEGHSRRVTAFTMAIARVMEVPGDRVHVIGRGAFLHDVGKMAIPDAILRKPGPLSPEEIVIMQKHCERGYQMLQKIPFLAEAAEIVYAHQERWDGTGYPRGLKGAEIPLGARIFAVADTLDAMTSDRPYRSAQSFTAAREEIERWSGRQFDPEVVRAFLSRGESFWEELRRNLDAQAALRAAQTTGA